MWYDNNINKIKSDEVCRKLGSCLSEGVTLSGSLSCVRKDCERMINLENPGFERVPKVQGGMLISQAKGQRKMTAKGLILS